MMLNGAISQDIALFHLNMFMGKTEQCRRQIRQLLVIFKGKSDVKIENHVGDMPLPWGTRAEIFSIWVL